MSTKWKNTISQSVKKCLRVEILPITTTVESGFLHVRDHMLKVRDLSCTLRGREHTCMFVNLRGKISVISLRFMNLI